MTSRLAIEEVHDVDAAAMPIATNAPTDPSPSKHRSAAALRLRCRDTTAGRWRDWLLGRTRRLLSFDGGQGVNRHEPGARVGAAYASTRCLTPR
jgi:hypothetical protein